MNSYLTFRSEMSSSDVSVGLGALFGEVSKVRLPFGTMDTRLGAISTMSFVEENSVNEKIENLASIIGYERFYLKAGNLLHTKSAEIGLHADGVIAKSPKEEIIASKRIDEEVRLQNSEKRRVINPMIGEVIAAATQIDQFNKVKTQFMTQRVAEGVSVKQAEKEAKEITPEVIEKAKVLKAQKYAKKV